MLPRKKRLNLKKDFKWVASGKKINSKFTNLFVRTGENTFPRVGIATSSKVFKKPTQRNRARRLISASFEALYKYLPQRANIVALPKRGVLDVKSNDVLLDLELVLKREGLI